VAVGNPCSTSKSITAPSRLLASARSSSRAELQKTGCACVTAPRTEKSGKACGQVDGYSTSTSTVSAAVLHVLPPVSKGQRTPAHPQYPQWAQSSPKRANPPPDLSGFPCTRRAFGEGLSGLIEAVGVPMHTSMQQGCARRTDAVVGPPRHVLFFVNRLNRQYLLGHLIQHV
jgi:hypothetical protein